MRVVIQRVGGVRLFIDNELYNEIGKGLLVLACVCKDDTEDDLKYMAKKIVNMRIFSDENGKFNLSLLDIKGECMIVSQFTLAADTKKGNRPSYFYAMEPQRAESMYEQFKELVAEYGVPVEGGRFGAMMRLEIVNEGPVTIYVDSKENLNKRGDRR